MDSPGHRANILNCDFKEIGVGSSTTAARTGPRSSEPADARRRDREQATGGQISQSAACAILIASTRLRAFSLVTRDVR